MNSLQNHTANLNILQILDGNDLKSAFQTVLSGFFFELSLNILCSEYKIYRLSTKIQK